MKRRIGNDFHLLWLLKENGVQVDISTVIDFRITVHLSSTEKFTPNYSIQNGSPLIECSKEQIKKTGTYYFVARWRVADVSFDDGYRDCTADIDSFEIVPRTAEEKDVSDHVTSEVAIGFRGMSSFEVWQIDNPTGTMEQFFAYLKQPATEAAATANNAATAATNAASSANTAANNANNTNSSVQQAEGARVTAEQGRVTAESGRVTVEGARVTAESSRASAESTRSGNENTRQSQETARVSAESSRVTAESNRATVESARVTAEQGRASAETTRGSNETTRQSQETTRQSNETTRQSQEAARVSAEANRDKKQLATIFNANNIIESAKIPNTTIVNNTGIPQTSTTHFAIFGIATKTIVLNSSVHNQIHFYDKNFNYLGYSPENTGTTIDNTLNAAFYGISISNTSTLKIISNDEFLQSQIQIIQDSIEDSNESIEQTKEYPNYWLNSGETGFPENIIETDASRVVTVISTPTDAPFNISVLPTIRKLTYTLPSNDKKFMANIMQDAPKITFMFWTKASQLTAAACTTIRVLGKIGGVQNWRHITLPTSIGQEQKNNQDEEMRLKMIAKYGDWVCFRLQWDNTVHTNYFMFMFNVSLPGELYFANVFLSKSIINIDALTVRYKLRNSTLPVLMSQFYPLLNSSKNFLYGNEFYSLCDSLGTDGTWQYKLATLSGAIFSNTKNNDIAKPLSIGGTATIGNAKNCGQWRARNLVENYPTAKTVFIENINDMNSNNGVIGDIPYMLSRIDNYPDCGLTSLAAANSYWATNFATMVASYTPIKGACLNIPYYGTGKNLKITGLPTSNGNVSIVVNGITFSIAVTTGDTMQTLIAKILEYQYGLVTDSANADGISVDFYYLSGVTVTFNASSTGMTVAITDTTTAQIFTPRYFIGEANTSDWNNTAKWSSNTPTTYSAMRGLIEYLQTNLPTCELIWIIPTRYGIALSSYLRADGTPDIDAFNAADTTYQSLCIKQKAICDLYNIRYVDLNKKSGITLYNLLTYYNENNVHPKVSGYEKWGEMIYRMLIG